MKPPSAPPENSLYPVLNTEHPDEETQEEKTHETGHDYRLQKISEISKTLEKERDTRRDLYKKYKRGVNIMDSIDTTLISFSIIMAALGFAIPILLPLEIGAACCAGVGACITLIRRRLNTKSKKHSDIKTLAESKLNSIEKNISKALEDNKISDTEFKGILTELDNYNSMKKEKLSENKIKELTEKERKELIEQGKRISEEDRERLIAKGKQEALEELKKKMTEDL